MRRRLSCPDCGWTPPFGEYRMWEADMEGQDYFNCPRCKVQYTHEDFFEENKFKWQKEADLSYENCN